MGYGAIQVLEGITLLSELGIDIDKDWQGYPIHNLEDPADDQDAATRSYLLGALAAVLNTHSTFVPDVDTDYQNETAYAKLIRIAFTHRIVGDSFYHGGYSEVTIFCGETPATAVLVGKDILEYKFLLLNPTDEDVLRHSGGLNFICPAGYWWRVELVTSGAAIPQPIAETEWSTVPA